MNPLLSLFLLEDVACVISNFLITESFIAPCILSYSLFQGYCGLFVTLTAINYDSMNY